MKKSELDKLLERYMNGQLSEEEKRKVETWMEINKSGNVGLESLSDEDEARILASINKEISLPTKLSSGKSLIMPTWSLGIAAGILLLISVSILLWSIKLVDTSTKKMILADGTIVWLRGTSTLSYYEKPGVNARYSSLHGEALFEVAKNPARPFFVECGEVIVRVVGTSFTIKTQSDTIELEVLTGKVHLTSKRDTVGVDVSPGLKVRYSTQEISRVEMSQTDIAQAVSSTDYNMKFSNEKVNVILERIEEKFDVTIKTEQANIKNCRMTADFTDKSLESTLQIISEVLNLTYRVDQKTVFIKGEGCK